jgi:predicted dehydrogenase
MRAPARHPPRMTDRPLRIGILGAARIAPMALVRPARAVEGVVVAAVAARDAARAREFAAKHGIARVHDTYSALIADPELDAIYNPLPNSHHCVWTVRALEAGKHVLCEKPLASNAAEAETMAAAAARTGRILFEAFHWRYHPLAARMLEVLASGAIGRTLHVAATFCVPLLIPGDIRYRLDLAGGATMDTGCYAIHVARTLAGAEPAVKSAQVKLSSPNVDRWMAAELAFPQGFSGRVECSLASARLLAASARVVGDRGELRVTNPIAPHLWHSLVVETKEGRRAERVRGDATYVHQLRAFRAAVSDGAPFPTTPADGVANMRVIDAVYAKAGLPLRAGTPV